jgi:hypothetical protein
MCSRVTQKLKDCEPYGKNILLAIIRPELVNAYSEPFRVDRS